MYKKIKIVYHNKEYKIQKHGDFFDLATSKNYSMQAGSFELLDLGVSMRLPKWYGAIVIPRSSTYKNFNIIQANSIGYIDNLFCGQNDRWKFPAIANNQVLIEKNSRICQFRLILDQNAPFYIKILNLFTKFTFKQVDVLHGKDRGGFGKSGVK